MMQLERRFPEFIDNTMRKELVKCQKAAHYRFELGLQPTVAKKVDLHAGAAFARGMETVRRAYYVERLSNYEAIDKGIAAVVDAYGDFQTDDKEVKTMSGMSGALVYYWSRYPLEKERLLPLVIDGKTMIEVSFAFDIPVMHPETGKPLKYCGRFDALVQDGDGRVWVMDEKTTRKYGRSQDWSKWANQWPLDSQMTGYVWGAKQLLAQHHIDLEVAGAVINGVAIGKDDYDVLRVTAHREDWMVQRWWDQMVSDVRDWRDVYADGTQHRMNLDHACAYYGKPCVYDKLCTKRNPERFMEGNYVVQFWNPMARDES